jgi:hypothetical protein
MTQVIAGSLCIAYPMPENLKSFWSVAMNKNIRSAVLSRIMMMFAAMLLVAGVTNSAALAQIQTVDPNDAIGSDINLPSQPSSPSDMPAETNTTVQDGIPTDGAPAEGSVEDVAPPSVEPTGSTIPSNPDETYQKDDLIGAAEGVFGKGAEGLAGIIEDILKKQGQPNAYIVGREGGGAFVVGLRYGSGTMYHKVEGEQKAYWTGPSIGFDAGANAGSTFILVYNLYDSEDLYKRFPSAEGVAYLVGGFNASYLRRGDVVLIPVRVGAGLRLGANVGYMKFSKKQRWLPF